jgi:hypothetical protein
MDELFSGDTLANKLKQRMYRFYNKTKLVELGTISKEEYSASLDEFIEYLERYMLISQFVLNTQKQKFYARAF